MIHPIKAPKTHAITIQDELPFSGLSSLSDLLLLPEDSPSLLISDFLIGSSFLSLLLPTCKVSVSFAADILAIVEAGIISGISATFFAETTEALADTTGALAGSSLLMQFST